jgi:hypothetical protein
MLVYVSNFGLQFSHTNIVIDLEPTGSTTLTVAVLKHPKALQT